MDGERRGEELASSLWGVVTLPNKWGSDKTLLSEEAGPEALPRRGPKREDLGELDSRECSRVV